MADETKEGSETGGNGKADDARIMEQVDARLAKGEARMIVADLMRENFESRDKIRDLKKQVPGDGAVVLKGDDATAWSRYRELGSPKDLRDAITQRDEYAKTNATYAREKLIGDVAELTYPGKAKVLAKLIPDDAEFEFSEVKDPKTGKTSKVAMLKSKVEGEKSKPLTDVIAADHAEFLPALTGSATNAAFRPNTTPAPRTLGTQAPPSGKSEEDLIYEETAARGGYSRM